MALDFIEEELGFKISELGRLSDDDHTRWLFSDFRIVPRSPDELMLKEKVEYYKYGGRYPDINAFPDHELLVPGRVKFIRTSLSTLRLECISPVGFYRFLVRVEYEFGLVFSLMLTYHEVHALLLSAQLRSNMVWNVSPASKLLGLPPEIREKVYGFALGTRLLKLKAGECVRRKHLAFAEGLGEPSGFYFPVLVDSPLPFLSRQIRTEGLPLAFRRVSLTADDMDGLIRLLIAIGDIGRSNVVSISCLWESCSEKAEIWARDPWAYPTSQLPRLHVLTAGFLLRQCRRLKHLCLYMYRDALNELSLESFKIDSGIRELCSMRNIERVDILDHEQQPIEENELVEWLKGEIQGNT